MTAHKLIRALPLLTLLTGCPSPDPSTGVQTLTAPDQFLDYNGFVCDVQPTLIRRCSYLGCHGQSQHALRIFSVGKLRNTPSIGNKAERDAPLTADEIELNFASASGIVYPTSAADRDPANANYGRDLLLAKPLAARFGGSEHHGVAVFPQYGYDTPEVDPDFMALVAWAGGKKQASPPSETCTALFTALGVPPRSP